MGCKLLKIGTSVAVMLMLAGWNRLQAQPISLFTNGTTDYVIVVYDSSSAQCRFAASELAAYLKRITGAEIPMTNVAPARHAILFEEGGSSDSSFNVNQLNNDGFRIKSANNNLLFTAKTGQGLKNAVYTFLDDYLDCRYYSTNAIVIPQKKDITLPALDDLRNPTLIYRTTQFVNTRDSNYVAWHKLTGDRRDGWGLFVHTMYNFVPASEFSAHPEYFAERNAIRVPDQLCLSNPEVLRRTIEKLQQLMVERPNAKYWSVSQLDNYQFCECTQCKAIDDREGSPAGSTINFANQVAAKFPDKIISTLAYQYSRRPPLHLKPTTNLNIMLCSIESDRRRPLAEDKNDGFARDLAGWAKLSGNIMIWDYVVNFSHLEAPFPNLHVLKPNINLFLDNHATMLFEQGHPAAGAEFNELRCYLICKLMWNPKADVDRLMNDFLAGYYGEAGPIIRQYIDLETKNVMTAGRALTLYEPPASYAKGYLSPASIREYSAILDRALAAVKSNPTLSNRVEVVRQAARYSWLEVCKYQVFSEDWLFAKDSSGNYAVKTEARDTLEIFYRVSKQFGNPMLNEKQLTADSYHRAMNDYFENGVIHHLAVGKKITFEKPPAAKYPGNGPESLIDGVRGTVDYQVIWQGWDGDDVNATIDLLTAQTVSGIETSCVDDWLSWIIAPESISVSVSMDGVTYTPTASFANPDAGKKIEKQVVKFSVPFEKPVEARYLKVHIKNLGKLPPWRGINGKAWLFVDEIVVK
jgi:hypothetical protein